MDDVADLDFEPPLLDSILEGENSAQPYFIVCSGGVQCGPLTSATGTAILTRPDQKAVSQRAQGLQLPPRLGWTGLPPLLK